MWGDIKKGVMELLLMDNNSKILKELVKFVKEQKETNKELKSMAKDHEKWMRTHEVRLSLHYDLIRELGNKLK